MIVAKSTEKDTSQVLDRLYQVEIRADLGGDHHAVQMDGCEQPHLPLIDRAKYT